MERLPLLLAVAILVLSVHADCSSERQQCSSECNGSMSFNCYNTNGMTQSSCVCTGGGGGNGGNDAEYIILIIVAVILQLICCVLACACIILCVRLAVSAIGLALICDFLILVNSLLGIISIEGAIGAIWETITDSAGLSTLTIVQLVIPLIIVVMCYANTVPTNIIALIMCLITIVLQIAFFSVLFAKDSVVPYVGTISVAVGILIVACSLGIMFRVLQTLRELRNPTVVMVSNGMVGDPGLYSPYQGQQSMTQLPAYGSPHGQNYGSSNGNEYYPVNGGGYGTPYEPHNGGPDLMKGEGYGTQY